MSKKQLQAPLRVAIIGGGLSGLCLANALLQQPDKFDVQIYERDTSSFDSERGGYQIRLGQDGIDGLKTCMEKQTYDHLKNVWGSEISRAPALIDPYQFKLIARLATLKVYPQSRAVPRQALKKYLLQLPLERGFVHFSHRLQGIKFEPNPDKSNTEAICSFDNGEKVRVDLVIGADGARSAVNAVMNIRNVRGFDNSMVVQGRCQRVHGFCAVYDAYVDGRRSDSESFLFWGVHLQPHEVSSLPRNGDDKETCFALAKKLEDFGLDPSGIPSIVRAGHRNVKIGHISSSADPGDWRKNQATLGRVILIGDSIHAMTPGRGQGANQAMKDAGDLAMALMAKDLRGASDTSMLEFSTEFEKAMYKRAFAWVKASEQAFEVTTDTLRGYYTVLAFYYLVHLMGIGASTLELLGLKSRQTVEF